MNTKRILLMCLCSIFLSTYLFSQSPIWTIGNQQMNWSLTNSQALPTPAGPSGLDYSGQQAQYAANAWHNPVDGSLLFFVVDHKVYDGEGYLIDWIMLNGYLFCDGLSEISIVPDPNDCKRFYILTTTNEVSQSTNSIVGFPVYAILDLNLDNINNIGRKGALVINNQGTTGTAFPVGQNFVANPTLAQVKIAVSPKRNDNSHLIFISDSYAIHTFTLDANGITPVGFPAGVISFGLDDFVPPNAPMPYIDPLLRLRGELELAILANGNLRIAVPYVYRNSMSSAPYTFTQNLAIFYAELSPAGILIPSTDNSIHLAHNSQLTNRPYVHGLEFSPNGELLYVAHVPTEIYPYPVRFLDFNNLNAGLQNLSVDITEIIDFSQSHLEVAQNGALLMASGDRIAAVANPNTPNAPNNWVNNYLPISYAPNSQGLNSTWWNTTFTLPDQLDFDPNCQIACYNNCNFNSSDAFCCEFYSGNVFVPESDIIEINTATVWEPGASGMPFNVIGGVGVVRKNIVVKPGASLTINNLTLEFFNEKQIIVERAPNTNNVGGRLYVNNSNLTVNSNCGNCTVWGGIVLQGHTTVSPSSLSHAYAHINNSNIEHASTAISSSAGQLLVNESTFKNNSISINLFPYDHPYQCNIFKSHFFTDGILNNPVNHPLATHIRMHRARRVTIQGCIFENLSPELYTPETRGLGIFAISSAFHASSCDPGGICAYGFQQSAFNNLSVGIGTIGYFSGIFAYTVYACHFNNNLLGLAQINGFNSQITNCQFTIPSMVWEGQEVLTTGIHLSGSTDYTISENTFWDDDNNNMTGLNYGIIVDNSGPYSNQIDNNDFIDLHTATISQNTNAQDYYSLDYKGKGLQWLCNSFKGSRFVDIGVPTGLIANWQGACDAWNGTFQNSTANNSFNSPQPAHIRLGALVPPINYYHLNDPALTPTNITGTVFPIICTPPNPFDMNSICDYSPPVRSMQINDLIIARNSNLFEQAGLLEILDYGDRDSIIQEVLLPFMSAQEKRDMLNNDTITISDEVLINYILSNPPNTMLYQVLAFNSPLNDKVMYYVMEESTLPSGMKSQIVMLQNGVSEYDARLYSLQKLTVSCNQIENELISRYLNDTTGAYSIDNVVALFENSAESDIRIREKLFGAYITQGNVPKADSIKNILNIDFNDPDYHFLNDIAIQLIDNDIHTLVLSDSSLVDRLESIAELELPLLSPRAVALLNIIEPKFEVFVHDYSVDNKNQQLIRPQYTHDGSIYEPITIFPNPASDHFFIVFDENADVSQSREARVYDLAGNLQFTRSFDDKAYVLEINTENMTKGMYIVVISENGTDVGTYKVAVR